MADFDTSNVLALMANQRGLQAPPDPYAENALRDYVTRTQEEDAYRTKIDNALAALRRPSMFGPQVPIYKQPGAEPVSGRDGDAIDYLRSLVHKIPSIDTSKPSEGWQHALTDAAMVPQTLFKAAGEAGVNWLDAIAQASGYKSPTEFSPIGPGEMLTPPGAGVLANMLSRPPANAVGVFGGRLAKTADQAALARAEEMAARGAPREDIWRDTGWFQGTDGKWRFEIDDSQMKHAVPLTEWIPKKEDGKPLMAPNLEVAYNKAASQLTPEAPVRLKRLFEHPELDRAYRYGFANSQDHPGIMGMPVQLIEGGNVSGQFVGPLPYGVVGLHETLPPGTAKSTALHEIQHAVEDFEGFARGGSTKGLAAELYNRTAARINDIISEAGGNLQYATAAQRQEVESLRKLIRGVKTDGDAYRRLAGEVEARNVQTRANMTADERRATPPWLTEDVPATEQIVRFLSANPREASLPGAVANALERRFDMTPDGRYKTTEIGPVEVSYKVGPDGIWLSHIATDEAARGQGLGRSAMRDFIAEAEQAGKPIRLIIEGETPEAEKALAKFYKSLGFREDGGIWTRPVSPPKKMWPWSR